MIKKIIIPLVAIVSLASCSTLRPLDANNNRTVAEKKEIKPTKEVKFLNDINVSSGTVSTTAVPSHTKTKTASTSNAGTSAKERVKLTGAFDKTAAVESVSDVQLKYSILLDMEVENLVGMNLLDHVDDWYGTRYRLGGTSKAGIDCSAFVQAVYLSAFGLAVPRTAREQHAYARKISTTELKEGDLVFFNTGRGVSHVGIYLRNNKFIHASVSQGVTVSDMYESYYLKRYLGAGRIEKPEAMLK